MFGMGYVNNHCISLFQKEEEEKEYKDFYLKSISYIAQGLQCLVNGLAQEEALTPYVNYIEDKTEDIRTAEEIVDDVLEKCGLGG